MREEQGFTLIELAVTMIVAAVLLVIGLPALSGHSDRAHDAEARLHLAVGAKHAKLIWREDQQFPSVGDSETDGSLIARLSEPEPHLVFAGNVGDAPTQIQVNRVDAHRVTLAAQSRSENIVCLELIARQSQTPGAAEPGIYWASGPAGSEDPCGQGAQTGTGPDGGGLPDPPAISEPENSTENEGSSQTGTQPFLDAGLLSEGEIDMAPNSTIDGNVATNAHVSMGPHSSICGNLQVGDGESVHGHGQISCGGTVQQGALPELPALDLPAANDNDNIWGTDTFSTSGPTEDPYDADSQRLHLRPEQEAILRGSVYVFCSVHLEPNSSLLFANPGDVTIYIDTPDSCSGQTQQLTLKPNSRLNAATGSVPESVAIVMLAEEGSGARIEIEPNSHLNMSCATDALLYAPNAAMMMKPNSQACAAVAIEEIRIEPNAVLDVAVTERSL